MNKVVNERRLKRRVIPMLWLSNLQCSYRTNPVGIGEMRPDFSWIIQSDLKEVIQTAYQIQVASESDFDTILWDTDFVESDRSVHIHYHGPELKSRTCYFWRARIKDNHGEISGWTDGASYFETGLLHSDEWKAGFISADAQEHSAYSSSAPLFRKEFKAQGEIASARIYITALGLYELRLNGRRVGDFYLTPGWTSYNKRLQYQTYDITEALQQGSNAVGALIGNGWYKGPLASWEGDPIEKYGTRTALSAEIHIDYKNGERQEIVTDQTWKTCRGPIIKSEIYDGEIYDATKETEGWDLPRYDETGWNFVSAVPFDRDMLIAQENIPVKKNEILHPVEMFTTPDGDTVLDFGQNMVGWVRFRVHGPRGSRVVLHHAEILDAQGNFYTENLRSAKQTVEYILKGTGEEIFEPHFTYQGFRYVRVAEYPGKIEPENFEAVVLHSGMERTGFFSCSQDSINRLQHNIVWGQKGNFVDIPTDCPQRDERLGWTGDAQVFTSTACYNMDVALFLKKWLRDLKADQLSNGQVPYVVPHVLKPAEFSSSGWGDAAVICPWEVYLAFGDRQVLEEQYCSMKGWVEYIRSQANGNCWDTGTHFGDWLALDRHQEQDDYHGATPNEYVSTAFYAYSTAILSKAAGALGKADEQKEYLHLFSEIKRAFQHKYFTSSGSLTIQTQTTHVLALMFDLVEECQIGQTVNRLIDLLKAENWHLNTGFLGTPYLCHVLSRYGHPEIAYKILLQRDYPSWLYQISKGATTIWEHWDGIKPNGGLWSPDMNSFNHYAYGSIGNWLYQVAAGINIDAEEPGYKHIVIKPVPNEAFSWVKAEHITPYGSVKVNWNTKGPLFFLDVQIPHNTRASIYLPCSDPHHVTGNESDLRNEPVEIGGKWIKIECGSGSWNFHCPFEL